jgi:peptide alpha-N-acetyltransferase
LTTKYLLQADKEDEALEKMALFTRHESDPEQNIFDMQVTWYELELAACYGRKKMFGKCLKKYSKFWIPSLRTN